MKILFIVFFVGLVVFHLLERLAPIHKNYRTGPKRRSYLADLTSSIVNGPVLSVLTKILAAWIVILVPVQWEVMTDWPWLLQLGVFLLVNDFARYWLHRWYHASDFLWRFHRVHHTIVEMDALSSFRVHLGEALIKYGVLVLPFGLMGVDPSVVLLYSSVDIIKSFWHHANLRTYIGSLNYLLNSAELHWWHHSTEARGQRANYGSIFSIWDWLFGTAYWPKGQWPETIGVDGMENFPDTFLGQLASARLTDDAVVQAYSGPETDHPELAESDSSLQASTPVGPVVNGWVAQSSEGAMPTEADGETIGRRPAEPVRRLHLDSITKG